jgi:hypothetical protein
MALAAARVIENTRETGAAEDGGRVKRELWELELWAYSTDLCPPKYPV